MFGRVNGQEKPIIRYEGSSTIGHFIRDAQSAYTKAVFEINTESESSGGERAIIQGTADIGGVARIPQAQVLGKGVVSTLLGWDAIAVIVNRNNAVTNLTKDKLKDIFTGKVRNWSQLGGPDLLIKPYIVSNASATHNVFRSAILGQADYSECETIIPDKDILEKVANEEGAIGQISFSFLGTGKREFNVLNVDGQEVSSTNQSYPITRPLYILWWPGRQAIADFAKWTQSVEAQKIVTQRYIGKQQETIKKTGQLIVYTKTRAVEEGGAYFYPHESYEIYTSDGQLLQNVANHIEPTDENPSTINLAPGQYIIWTKTAIETAAEKILVNIEAGQSTRINIQQNRASRNSTAKPKEILGSNLKLYGDFRFRAEQDWNSQRSNGTYRDDRGRLRYRLRIGFNYKWSEQVTFGGRLRSGNKQDPQSPHITLGENLPENGITIDKAYLRLSHKNRWVWLGKNNNPFWKQNEMWWDDDVTPEGAVLGTKFDISPRNSLDLTAGYFVMYSLGRDFTFDPGMSAAQLVFRTQNKKTSLTLASGFYSLTNMPQFPDSSQGNSIDYQLLISSAELQLKTKLPVSIGIDNMSNFVNYSADTLISASGLQEEKMAYVVNFKLGSLSDKGKFLLAYYYAFVPKYAVVPYLAQDDWIRWDYGNGIGSRASNYKGHEFRLAYAFGKGFNVVARAYFVEGIKKNKPENIAIENGNRFRLDFNLKF